LLAAAGGASLLSVHRTGGRDAVRLTSRPSLSVPGWRIGVAPAEWEPKDLAWGPLYEPHRHPGGAPVGERLALPAAAYRLEIDVDEVGPDPDPPLLVVRPDGPREGRVVVMVGQPGRRSATFETPTGASAVTLSLREGGPFVIRRIKLMASTFDPDPGLNR
jgi:hypothetical protein